jgi:hypothetical protein
MKPQSHRVRTRAFAHSIATILVGGLLSACASTGGNSISGFDQVTLAPGDTGNCESSPCQVYLEIPAGSGSYEVTANEVRVGNFPGGQTASLGSFWQSQAFEIKGMDVPKAYAYIPQQR